MSGPASAAVALAGPGKGILAADESLGAVSARLAAAGVAPTAANRRAYREMLVTTPGLAPGSAASSWARRPFASGCATAGRAVTEARVAGGTRDLVAHGAAQAAAGVSGLCHAATLSLVAR